jgi:hypothetical protein
MAKLEATKKLKSSPIRKLNARIYLALGNANLTSSADFSFRKSRIKAVSDTCRAKHCFEGCIEQAITVLL